MVVWYPSQSDPEFRALVKPVPVNPLDRPRQKPQSPRRYGPAPVPALDPKAANRLGLIGFGGLQQALTAATAVYLGAARAVNMKIEAFRGWTAFARRLLPVVILGVLGGSLAACNFSIGGDPTYKEDRDKTERGAGADSGTMFGEGGLFGAPNKSGTDNGTGVGVNSLLWRASLDTISFMPLVSADPFGGVIITDWYTPPQTPNERFKVNIYILGRALRADGVRASVFRQTNDTGTWADAPVALNTSTDLENAILTRARQLRMSGVQQ
jgi:hypothetical protein